MDKRLIKQLIEEGNEVERSRPPIEFNPEEATFGIMYCDGSVVIFDKPKDTPPPISSVS